MSKKKRNKKQSQNYFTQLIKKQRVKYGVNPAAWHDSRVLYEGIGLNAKLKFNQTPIAIRDDNRCPKCNRLNNKKIKVLTVGTENESESVYECPCININSYLFVYRPFPKKKRKLTVKTLPKKMTQKEYDSLPISKNTQFCSNLDCSRIVIKFKIDVEGTIRLAEFCDGPNCLRITRVPPDSPE